MEALSLAERAATLQSEVAAASANVSRLSSTALLAETLNQSRSSVVGQVRNHLVDQCREVVAVGNQWCSARRALIAATDAMTVACRSEGRTSTSSSVRAAQEVAAAEESATLARRSAQQLACEMLAFLDGDAAAQQRLQDEAVGETQQAERELEALSADAVAAVNKYTELKMQAQQAAANSSHQAAKLQSIDVQLAAAGRQLEASRARESILRRRLQQDFSAPALL